MALVSRYSLLYCSSDRACQCCNTQTCLNLEVIQFCINSGKYVLIFVIDDDKLLSNSDYCTVFTFFKEIWCVCVWGGGGGSVGGLRERERIVIAEHLVVSICYSKTDLTQVSFVFLWYWLLACFTYTLCVKCEFLLYSVMISGKCLQYIRIQFIL